MFIEKIKHVVFSVFFKADAVSTLAVTLLYVLVSYLLLVLAGEHDITAWENFGYWLAVTASTVGYGDLSPSTLWGKVAVSLWVIPVGLSIFAFLIARVSFALSERAFRGRRGLRHLNTQNHTVIIGWNEQRTLRLIELLLDKHNAQNRDIVLCVAKDIENPLPNKIGFVKVESFSHQETMSKACLETADRIIIDTPLDDVTLTTALYCQKVSPHSHKTAYFQDESIGDLLLSHCPGIEIIPSVSVELLAKSTIDPGSSQLHKQLLDSSDGMTQFSSKYQGNKIEFEPLFDQLKRDHDATLIGVRQEGSQSIKLNPPLTLSVVPGDTLFYIAATRLTTL
ncbi:potassium channel family protein [Neptunomonas phycophila]|uniref:Potassium channel family protein n=1 Tax=Neptunomonas phycophila TaxID=1572645 RepID=A0AAW7XJL6_9GAMM|nr:potassium channel family protein [Neptunomonas phycophila]MDO6453143.1 potassium channel family protein [Neptunomonas phycophila]MDP2523017.1 potassium channel family protein [Neptunomonas phycophila]